mgnify:CR=1 FL=1
MTRRKTITPSTMIVDDMHHLRNGIIQIRRTHTLHIGTYPSGTCLVGKSNGERKAYHAKQCDLPMKIAQHHIPDGSIHGNPNPLTAISAHKIIEIHVVHPIDGKKYVCVYIYCPLQASISAVIRYLLAISSYNFCK